jgi:pimeloyl-ACP methyl ester carboxylesterase
MPAVLVHGVPDTTQRWDGVRSRLTRTDVVTPALPGPGSCSGAPTIPTSPPTSASASRGAPTPGS